jgi:hypothetical protein
LRPRARPRGGKGGRERMHARRGLIPFFAQRANISLSLSHSPHPRQQHPGRRRLSAFSRNNRALLFGYYLGFGGSRHDTETDATLAACLSGAAQELLRAKDKTRQDKTSMRKKRCRRNPAFVAVEYGRACTHRSAHARRWKAVGWAGLRITRETNDCRNGQERLLRWTGI